ncbi:MAG TPA: ABC-F family ATP-binding cassette domain-containing protein [Phycisphaerae bacterium]|nr:ABC-F family ATP-binding cassette domain-containing protein [Phycisphaerae bacterium]
MSLIVGTQVGKSYGAEPVIRAAQFRIGPGERIGLVGPNGEGKTTLLRLLVGREEPTAGTISRRRDLRIGYLPQDPPAPAGTTLWQSAMEVFADLRAVEVELHDLAGRLHDDPDGRLLARYGELQHQFEAAGGYDCETRVKAVLTGLGFAPDQHGMLLAHLSGGQRTRALLGRLLLEEPEVLLLDEPTNHLDLEAVEWLEKYLAGYSRALVVVSHDRYFLDRVTRETWEVTFGQLESYRGSYSEYVRKREDRFRERMRQWETQQEFVARTEEFIRRNLSGQRTKEAQGRRTRLERFLATEAISRPREPQHVTVRIRPLQRSGDLVLRTADLTIGYDPARPLVEVGDLEVRRGERIALVGPNGAGKTTLLRTLLGQLAPLGGSARFGENVQPGYLPQTHDTLDGEATALQALMGGAAGLKAQRARTLLGGLLLRGEDVFKRVCELSGGQRSRVLFAQLAAIGPNVLLLDEPTNHLDLPSREIVQEMLAGFEGTVIFVSHDRYLIEALATHVWAMEDGRTHVLAGGWDRYVGWRAEYRAGLSQASPPKRVEQRSRREANLERRRCERERQRLQRRLEELEDAIHRHEALLAELMDASGRAGEAGDLPHVRELGAAYEKAAAELKDLWREYESLSEQLEG